MIHEYRDFEAVHDFMPGKGKPLRVTGTCCFTTSGWSARLEESSRPGPGLHMLTLDLLFEPPEDVATDVITCIDVRWEEQTETRYKEVEFRVVGDDQPPPPIPVQELEISSD